MSFIVPKDKWLVYPGQRFSRLTVAGVPFYWKSGIKAVRSNQAVVCQCECGISEIKYATALTGRKILGCHRCAYKTHGMRNTRLYRIWTNIKSRCLNESCSEYLRYGLRGITICDEWLDFNVFARWAAENGYDDLLTIDRIDGTKGYEPSNCRWANHFVQNNNRRHLCRYDGFGESKTIGEWSRDHRSVAPTKTVWHRLTVLRWNIERAITTPVDSRRGKRHA